MSEDKGEKYNWKETNLALFGSDTEKKVKKESAQTEPAWKDAGTRPGIQIWRIVKFKVAYWPPTEYGNFFNGDSYIILHTWQERGSEEFNYDIYFWIGQYSTSDEYGTAAYKTVELDTLLDDKATQHREVMDHESDEFLKLFPTMTKYEGGADSGYHRVEPTDYKPRLLHLHGTRRRVDVREVKMSKQSLDDSDVFILDTGRKLYQWNGTTSNKDEKFTVMQFVCCVKSARFGKCKAEVCDAEFISPNHIFMRSLSDEPVDEEEEWRRSAKPTMHRLSNASGRMEFTQVAEGDLPKAKLDSNDVFVVDTIKQIFVWIGKGASIDERRNALTYAHNYLQKGTHPLLPVCVVAEGRENPKFLESLS
ncbi:gelsolin-like protein 2 [Amphiura filiformis]|uniref:gelsolin-like protein 2 n=1 Tax=Amphiura filiformis TaxID=82378 RepID=UPI003B21198B